MRDAFITSNNFREYIVEAMNVYVATAFLSRAIIDDIKATLNDLPNKGGRNFRFLLNEDFHAEPEMRKILINMLLELPHTEVRVYKGPKMFHPKLYLFEQGNNIFAAIGSFNATAGGAGKHVEAGVETDSRKITKEAKLFFEQYWDSEYTQLAEFDEKAFFKERKFNPGDAVILIDTGENAVILNDTPQLIDHEWEYMVYVSNKMRRVKENHLKSNEIISIGEIKPEIDETQDSTVEGWLKNYILEKAFNLTDNIISTFATSRTEIYPYQFRPLYKMLNSFDHRLLIADEVGLGKTIEAGIILKEFSARTELSSVLIIAPNSLKTKWKSELEIRFDEYYEIISYRDLVNFLNDFQKSSDGAFVKGIISYDQLVAGAFQKKLKCTSDLPCFDLIIIDEAHHLKNKNQRYKVIERISRNAKAIVMLTATPIQLRSTDLFNLLNILAPRASLAIDSKVFSAKLTFNERINTAIYYIKQRDFKALKDVINELKEKRAFKKYINNFETSQTVLSKCLDFNEETPNLELRDAAIELYNWNILNQYITRTLRKDVSDNFPDREVKTYEYEYTKEEKIVYDIVLSECARKSKSRNNIGFSFVIPERRAASCLIAMAKSINNKMDEEYFYNIDIDDDSDNEIDQEQEKAISEEIDKSISTKLDKITLPSTDSKFNLLKTMIDDIIATVANPSNKKIMIFCAFIATIEYLKSTLQRHYPEAFVETIYGQNDDISSRDEKKNRFQETNSVAFLICSEVAGEGLDFQFCHYLINYDMPWNPAKLEQRVGRIDRIGQKSEKVYILNIVNKYTIEDHIMAKLFERVKLFNSTIGPLGKILSKYQKEFCANLLSDKRTEKEKKEYEATILSNIEIAKKEQEIFDEKQIELVGVMDYFYDEMQANETFFKEGEVKLLWDAFLKEYCTENDLKITIDCKDLIYSLSLSQSAKKMLIEIINKGCIDSHSRKKKKYYNDLIDKLESSGKDFVFTFNHKLAIKNLSIQFFNITHPMIQGALKYVKATYKRNKDILRCKISTHQVQPGKYILVIYRFIIMDRKLAKIEFIEEHYFIYNLTNGIGDWKSGVILFDEILKSGEIITGSMETVNIAENNEIFEMECKKVAQNILDKHRKTLNNDKQKQITALTNFYQGKIDNIKDQLKYANENNRKGLNKEIQKIEEEMHQKVKMFVPKDFGINIKKVGTIFINNM